MKTDILIKYLNSKNIQVTLEDIDYLGNYKYLAPFGIYAIMQIDELMSFYTDKIEKNLTNLINQIPDNIRQEIITYFNEENYYSAELIKMDEETIEFFDEESEIYYYIKEE
jgi:hypothetical protein